MRTTRRHFLALSTLSGLRLRGQGMATRNVKARPRAAPSGLPFPARFTDVAGPAGLRAPSISGHPEHNLYIVEAMGSGCAFFDYDNDGWLDVLVLSGSRMGGGVPGASNRLYKNNRDGTFTDVTEQAGLMRQGWAYGVTVGDYNNDGYEDLFITCWGQNILYRNNGNGTFTDVTKEAGLLQPRPRWGTGCTFVDYNRDGHLDLFVSHYLHFDRDAVPRAGASPACNFGGVLVHCGPRGLPPESCLLYRNNGNGTFTDVTAASGVGKASAGYGLTAVAADFDNDGWPDVYVACDSTSSLLFRNNHDGTFSEEALERGVALNEDGQEQSGMGIGIGDFDLDGNLDILKTHFAQDTQALYRNNGRGGFRDVTIRSGLGVETRYVNWGAGIADLDNNGWPDLFWVTGHVYPEVNSKLAGSPLRTPRVLFRNLGGGKFEELFEDVGPGIAAAHCSRGCAFGDFDNDGDLDILIMNQNEAPSLLRNDVTGANHWLKVKLVGVKSNRSAIGARLTARYGGLRQAQEVLAQSSYLSVNDTRLHFGLGSAEQADLDIRWPNGTGETIGGVPADRLVVIKEGAGMVATERFGRASARGR